jgi:hypothetical protein
MADEIRKTTQIIPPTMDRPSWAVSLMPEELELLLLLVVIGVVFERLKSAPPLLMNEALQKGQLV